MLQCMLCISRMEGHMLPVVSPMPLLHTRRVQACSRCKMVAFFCMHAKYVIMEEVAATVPHYLIIEGGRDVCLLSGCLSNATVTAAAEG